LSNCGYSFCSSHWLIYLIAVSRPSLVLSDCPSGEGTARAGGRAAGRASGGAGAGAVAEGVYGFRGAMLDMVLDEVSHDERCAAVGGCGEKLGVKVYLRIIPKYQPSVIPRNSLFRGMAVFPRNAPVIILFHRSDDGPLRNTVALHCHSLTFICFSSKQGKYTYRSLS